MRAPRRRLVTGALWFWWVGLAACAPEPEVDLCAEVGLPEDAQVILADGQQEPAWIAVEDGVVYWVSLGDETLWRVAATGGSVERIGPAHSGMAVDGDALYLGAPEGLVRIGLTDGTRTVLAPDMPRLGVPVVDGNEIFVGQSSVSYESREGRVLRFDAAIGGPPEELMTGLASPGVAVDADHVYFTNHTGSRFLADISRVPRAGGPVEVLLDDINNPTGLTLDDEWVYMGNSSIGDNQLYRARKADPRPEVILVSERFIPAQVDDGWVYGIDIRDRETCGQIGRLRIEGGELQIVATSPASHIWQLVVANGSLFWTEWTTGRVMTMPLP